MFDYLSDNSNKCNPYADWNNYHCLGFPSRSKHSACRPLGLPVNCPFLGGQFRSKIVEHAIARYIKISLTFLKKTFQNGNI